MINCIFTLDYEIYGNGEGSLRELVYDPAERLRALFDKWNCRFVAFVEVGELLAIDTCKTDDSIALVKRQVQDFHKRGYELGLHIHPQWFNARYQSGNWILDDKEYILGEQPRERITEIVARSVEYLRQLLGEPDYSPLSYRAGNWLFQPSQTTAAVLIEHGIKIDSSVFKGGLQREHKLDYRRALKNDYLWKFSNDVQIPDDKGLLIELPIYTRMVRPWKLLTRKRIGLERKAPSALRARGLPLFRLLDFLRFRYPIKFDFCRLTIDELTRIIDVEIGKDLKDPSLFRPIVAIGHTKDLVDIETIESLLSYLKKKGISVKTFADISHSLTINLIPRYSYAPGKK
jgi:hypothetical protein